MGDDGDRILLREAWPEVTGRPGLAQGRYGAAGNLELVVPAVDGGLWVGWFNCDPVESYSGAAIQRWSGALRFAHGHRYVSADVTQVDAGPAFLEVVALTTGGILRRHVWSPEPGFVDHGELTGEIVSCSAVVQNPVDGSLQLAVAGLDGRVRILQASPGAAYPAMTFEVVDPGIAGAVTVDAAWHDDHLDLVTVGGDELVHLWCAAWGSADAAVCPAIAARLVVEPDGGRLVVALGPTGRVIAQRLGEPADEGIDLGVADALVAAPVRLDERADCHVVTRRGRQLWHQRTVQARALARAIEAEVWVEPETRTAHRG